MKIDFFEFFKNYNLKIEKISHINRSAAECWVKIPEPTNMVNTCLSKAMDFSRFLGNTSFEIVTAVEKKVKHSKEELSIIIKNAKKSGKIEDIKRANLVVLNAIYAVKDGVKLIEKAEIFINQTFEVAKLEEQMARKEFEISETKESIINELYHFDMVMIYYIASQLFAREKYIVLEILKETFKKIEEVEDLIAKSQ